MLDDEHGDAGVIDNLPQVVEYLHGERAGDPCNRLVEQQQLWVAHHRAADVDELALAAGELARQVVSHVGDLELVEHRVRLSQTLPLIGSAAWHQQRLERVGGELLSRRHQQILYDCHLAP